MTEEYVYDAKFITGGKIAYIIQKEQTGANLFVLCICDREGKLIQTLDFSGSSFYLSADGRYGYGSGLMLEIVDLEKAQIIGQAQQTTASANADLLMALRGAVQVYAKMRLGHQATPEDIERYFANSDQAGGMAKAEIWARLPQTHQETAIYYEAILDREHSLMSAEGNFATCHILLIGMDHQGLTFAEELAWDAVKIDGRWQVVGLSTFSREQERTEVLAAVSQFLHAQLPQLASEAITWRQVQYWQKERAGLAGWLNEAEWAKVDADVGGLILWLQRKDGAWQVEQVWYDGGWIYPENAA